MGKLLYAYSMPAIAHTHRAQDQGPVDAAFCIPSNTHTDLMDSGRPGFLAQAHWVVRTKEEYPPNDRGWKPK